jgi:ketosteroid isomerase-like protein
MKRCPTCNRTYTDQNLSYCIDDGTPLISVAEDDDSTVVTPRDPASGSSSGQQDWNAAPYRPPGAYVPPGGAERRVWPWVVGVGAFLMVAFIGLGVSAWLLLPHLSRTSTNRNDNLSSNSNANRSGQDDSRNSNSNSNINSAEATADEPVANTNTDAPTNKEVVLAQLTDLEQEWTAANINADKKKLEQILADDYVGADENGQLQGKREYIRDIKRESSIERWDFRDLKVTLRGDRASLTGKIHLTIRGEEDVLEFTDKFVWRDGRWQATGSIVARAD